MSGPGPAAADDNLDVRLAVAGDARAFERLYFRHAGRIRTVSRRLLGESQADDGVQEVFLRAWAKLDSFRGESSFGTWIYRLGLNVLLRQMERARSRDLIKPLTGDEIVATPETSPKTDINRALQTLPEGLREVVVLHDMEDHTHEEIAELLGIGVSASKMRLHRARSALRSFISEHNHG